MAAAHRFEGTVALITGAGRGIGNAIAWAFASEGATVAVLDRDGVTANETAERLIDDGHTAFAVQADLSDPQQRAAVIPQVIGRTGQLDVLVHNAAAVGPRVPLTSTEDNAVRQVLEVNVIAPLLLSRDALPHLIRTRGAIVAIGSIQAQLPLPTHVPYAASKGAIPAYIRALAVEVAGQGVRVNAVAPGAVASPGVSEQGVGTDGAVPTLVGRWGSGDDVAAAVLFLASKDAAYISGEVLRVDGGRLLARTPDPFLEVAGS